MSNRDIQVARRYHEGTKHPGGGLLDPHHPYNPMRKPILYKDYPHAETVELPLDKRPAGITALEAIVSTPDHTGERRAPSLEALARLLYFTGGITKRIRFWRLGRAMPFRAAACTGALYHIETYLICGEMPGLAAGAYYYHPELDGLKVLRRGDCRGHLVAAVGEHGPTARAPAVLAFTDVFWRNAYKYQAREYRHAFWDLGTMLANTLAMTSAEALPAQVVLGFTDGRVSRLLGIQGQPELPLCLVPLGEGEAVLPEPATDLPPLEAEHDASSGFRLEYPEITRMHAASELHSLEDVEAWRRAPIEPREEQGASEAVKLDPIPGDVLPDEAIERVILRRGSTRQYEHRAITFGELSTILHRACRGAPADMGTKLGATLSQAYLIANAVDGLDPGSYVLTPDTTHLERLSQGDFRLEAGRFALGQELGADAAVNIYFLADFDRLLRAYGNRGYRAAQLDASLAAGRVYLAAYALGLGASGLTFFDDAVINFFSPHAEGKQVMFLITLGHPAY